MEGKSNIFFGQSAVYRVASELLLRGCNVYFPSVDIGADLIIDNGARIQVKSTRLVIRTKRIQSTYIFQLHGYRLKGEGTQKTWKKKSNHFSEKCDFVVLYGQTEQRFWIVPAILLDGKSHIVISNEIPGERKCRMTGLGSVVRSYENLWKMITSYTLEKSAMTIVKAEESEQINTNELVNP
jgi:hypothetical protein